VSQIKGEKTAAVDDLSHKFKASTQQLNQEKSIENTLENEVKNLKKEESQMSE
jgi:hypothetical protein